MNNNLIYLIDEGYVKDNSSIMSNVESQFFSEFILISQNIQLQEILGIDLYEEIIEQFTAFKVALESNPNAPILDSVEQRIVDLVDDYIQVVLLYYTLYHSIYNFQIKYTNKGAEEQKSNYSRNASQGSIENQRQQWKSFAEHYVVQLIKFLNDNVLLYPEYVSECEIKNDRSNNTGLYLGGSI